MGIDKSGTDSIWHLYYQQPKLTFLDIRNIIHWDFPNTVEEYCQQVGRAGRDGKDSYCMLYLCPHDFYIKENFARGDLPSHQSLRALFKDIFKDEVQQLSINETFKTNHNAQTSQFDIRTSPLSVIYALLELRFNLIRATTPEYSAYSFEATPTYYARLKAHAAPEAKAILSHARKATKLHHIDPAAASQKAGVPRPAIVRLLNELNDRGAIRLRATGVLNKYKVLGPLPRTNKELDALTDKVHAELEGREKQALERIQQVVSLFTRPACFARSLAQNFGMDLPGGSSTTTRCERCTFCVGGGALKLPPAPPKVVDYAGIKKILAATDVRDDPRFLARVAFGIKSPRVGRLKLDRTPVFASLADHDFEVSIFDLLFCALFCFFFLSNGKIWSCSRLTHLIPVAPGRVYQGLWPAKVKTRLCYDMMACWVQLYDSSIWDI